MWIMIIGMACGMVLLAACIIELESKVKELEQRLDHTSG